MNAAFGVSVVIPYRDAAATLRAAAESALSQPEAAEVLLVDGSAMGIFPVPNLLKAYQGHQLVLFNTPPLVFDKIAGLTVRDAGSFSDIFSQLELEL